MSQESENKSQGPEWVATDDSAEIYSNYIHVNWTMNDVRIRFGQLVPSQNGPPRWVIEERAAVTVPWPQIKVLAEVAAGLIAKYEAKNGELKPPLLPE